jgi:Arc/MetJ-type ribon-helix-helix transcriptional regulator
VPKSKLPASAKSPAVVIPSKTIPASFRMKAPRVSDSPRHSVVYGWDAVRIPTQYHYGMSKQIAVRLPDELVDYIDRVVAAGAASSRAAVVVAAIDRDRRRQRAERDAAILAAEAADGDLDELAEYQAQVPMPDLD